MLNLFQSPELKEEVPGYDIHLDQLADKEYEDFIQCINYMDKGELDPVTDLHQGVKGLCISLEKD